MYTVETLLRMIKACSQESFAGGKILRKQSVNWEVLLWIMIVIYSLTKQSNLLKSDAKYPCNPKQYILRSISTVNIPKNNLFAISEKKNEKICITP